MNWFGGGNSKETAAQQQIAQYGASWRAEVSDNGEWKPLDDWEALYEPPQPPQAKPSATSGAQAYMAAKAKEMLVNKMQKSVSSKIMTISEETTSKVLSRAEQEANAAAAKDPSNAQAWNVLSKLLNNVNGIVLTYRFEKHNPTKFAYLRREASDSVADTLQTIFTSAEDAGEHLEDMRTKITSLLESQKDKVRTFVETSLDESLQQAAANAEARTANKLAAAKKQLKNAAAGATIDGIPTDTPADPKTEKEIKELESNIQKHHEDIKDESVSMLADCIRLMVVKKLDNLVQLLVYALNKLFDSAEALYKKQTETKLDQQQLRDEVFNAITSFHAQFQSSVSFEVQRGVTVLESVMDESGGNDGGDDGSS